MKCWGEQAFGCKTSEVEQLIIREEGRLPYHLKLAARVNFLSQVQTMQTWVMLCHHLGPADPALATGMLLRPSGMWILEHVKIMLCQDAQMPSFCT